MMFTALYSIERALVGLASGAAVAAQGLWDAFTRRPGHDYDRALDGADVIRRGEAELRAGYHPRTLDEICADQLADAEAEEEVHEPRCPICHAPTDVTRADVPEVSAPICEDCWIHDRHLDTPNPTEPSLTDDELVGVRGLLQQRYGASPTVADFTVADLARATAKACGVDSGAVEKRLQTIESDQSPPAAVSPNRGEKPAAGEDWEAVVEVLADHRFYSGVQACSCHYNAAPNREAKMRTPHFDSAGWREHVAPLITERLKSLAAQPK